MCWESSSAAVKYLDKAWKIFRKLEHLKTTKKYASRTETLNVLNLMEVRGETLLITLTTGILGYVSQNK